MEINYIIKFNTEIYNEKNGVLIIDRLNQKSLFQISKTILKKEDPKESSEISIIQKDVERFITFDYKKDTVLTKEKINNEVYIISESVPNINWNMEMDNTKSIENFTCYKATTIFRGRKYIAWYSLDFPIQMGPWKFHGLPGLIMEIYDETNRYYWGVTQIKYSNKDLVFPSEIENAKTIDLKKYVDLRYNKIMENIDSKLPRGTISQTIKSERNGIEIKFEWE